MYVDRCLRIHDFRKPTIAAVQGKCVAAGLMLACMCDLIVAADDAVVLQSRAAHDRGRRRAPGRAVGAGHPQGQGVPPRRRGRSTPPEAWRLGLVNKVVPRDELETAHAGAGRPDRPRPAGHGPGGQGLAQPRRRPHGQGRRRGKYHFMAHHWVHNTATALNALAARKPDGLDEGGLRGPGPGPPRNERGVPRGRSPAFGSSTSAPGSAPPSAPGCSASGGPTWSRSSCPAQGDFMRTIGPFVPDGYSLFWAVEGRGRRERHLRPAQARGPGPLPPAGGHRRRGVRELPPGHHGGLGSRPRRPRPATWSSCASASSVRTGPTRRVPGSTGSVSPTAGCSTSPASPTARPVRPGVTVADYLTGVFAADAAVAALYGRDAGAGRWAAT